MYIRSFCNFNFNFNFILLKYFERAFRSLDVDRLIASLKKWLVSWLIDVVQATLNLQVMIHYLCGDLTSHMCVIEINK